MYEIIFLGDFRGCPRYYYPLLPDTIIFGGCPRPPPPAKHKEPNESCPFCPPPDQATYTTYPGVKNDSKKLGPIMEKPASITAKQEGAKPQTSRSDGQGYTQEQSTPKKRPEDKTTWYTHQAHHLISGKQALDGSPM